MQPPNDSLSIKYISSLIEIYSRQLTRILLALAVIVFILLLLVINIFPIAGVGVEVGKPSSKTIKAPQTTKVTDWPRTNARRRQAAEKIQSVFVLDKQVTDEAKQQTTETYRRLAMILNDGTVSAAVKQQKIRSLLPGDFSQRDLAELAVTPVEQISVFQDRSIELVDAAMKDKIKPEDLTGRRADLEKSIKDIGLGLGPVADKLIAEVAAANLLANYKVDSVATQKLVKKAVNRVKPVEVVKQKGETIVQEGELVTKDQFRTLKEMGMFQAWQITDFSRLLGLVMAVGVLIIISAVYLYEFQPKIFKSNRLLLLLAIILSTIIAIAKGIVPFAPSLLIPAAAAAMLATILLNAEAGIVMAVVSGLFLALIVGNEPNYLITALASGLVGVYLTAHVSHRSDLTRAGFWLMLVMGLLAMTSGLLAGQGPFDVLVNIGWGVIGGFFATVLTIGGTQFLEFVFNVTTDMKLLELANPAQTLLRDLMMTAPGTYNHSIITGNLAESAAEKVGANPLLARVGAYYHDIGKIRRPFFFIENQYGNNPHDKTKPNLSCLIITAHVKEGVELAKQHRLPKEIIDIIYQHHGTGLVSYFYNRAKENEDKEEISETDFRYPGDKPRSREAALVMLADAAEAAARTISKPSPNRIEQLIKKVIQTKLQDGQLDQSDLTLGDLEIIAKIYTQTLVNMYHSRIEYPACELPRRKKGVVAGSLLKQPVQHPR